MCSPAICDRCQKITWTGCGAHAARPASSSPATASSRAAHSATTAPSGVSAEPRGVRVIRATPACASADFTRADTAC